MLVVHCLSYELAASSMEDGIGRVVVLRLVTVSVTCLVIVLSALPPLSSTLARSADLPPRHAIPGGPQKPILSGSAVFVGADEVDDVVIRVDGVDGVDEGIMSTLGSAVVVLIGVMFTLGSGAMVVGGVVDLLMTLLVLDSSEKTLAAAVINDGMV